MDIVRKVNEHPGSDGSGKRMEAVVGTAVTLTAVSGTFDWSLARLPAGSTAVFAESSDVTAAGKWRVTFTPDVAGLYQVIVDRTMLEIVAFPAAALNNVLIAQLSEGGGWERIGRLRSDLDRRRILRAVANDLTMTAAIADALSTNVPLPPCFVNNPMAYGA